MAVYAKNGQETAMIDNKIITIRRILVMGCKKKSGGTKKK